jgi:glycosyltransferase involved in cell wall biosynthesis
MPHRDPPRTGGVSDVLIVIPVFNEADALAEIVARARRHGPVLVVDDGSSDASADIAARAGADVLRLPRRHGKGEALRRGFAEAVARGAEVALTLDGDGQHDPDEIPRLLAASTREPDALVVGDRLAAAHGVIPDERLAAMRVAGFFIDWLIGCPLRDTQSGFRVYPRRLIAEVRPRNGGFVFETEVLVRAAAGGFPIVETPVTARHFPERQSRFRPGRDGIAVGAYLTARCLGRWGREVAAVVAVLARPFSRERMRARHGELAQFSAPYRDNFGGFMLAVAAFAAHRTAQTWRGWWSDPRARRLRLAAAASALTPVLLLAAMAGRPLRALGADPVAFLVGHVYSQDRLAATFAHDRTEPAARAEHAHPLPNPLSRPGRGGRG